MTPHFESLAISGEMGVGKPEPAAFAEILRRSTWSPTRR